MNNLERALFHGAIRAQANHIARTGWWLWWGPESYLQYELARSIARTSHLVYTEASPKKIAQEHDIVFRGRPPKISRRRFDLVVWRKSENSLRAIIEIKRAGRPEPVISDARKVESYLNLKYSNGTGYLVVYSEAKDAKRRSTLARRIEKILEILRNRGWLLVTQRICFPRNGEGWGWSMCLLRYD